MDVDQVIRITLAVITPILTAGIGIGALVIGDWRDRRTQAGRRKLALEDASRQVAFAADWWNASKLIAHTPEAEEQAAARARVWLDEASDLVAESKPPPVEDKPAISARRLMLAYPMDRRAARILRALFYATLGIVVFQVSGAVAAALGRPDTLGRPDYFTGGLIYGDLIAVAVAMVIAMGFRFWALRAEDAEPGDHPRMTLRRAMLLYPFGRAGAKIARLVFWGWTILTVVVIVATAVTAFNDLRLLPANAIALIAWVGWAVGLRYWAATMNERPA